MNKYANIDGKRENGGNYQRALTLLNEAVGILTSPATATDASDCQPQLSRHSNLELQYKFQVLLKGKKWPGSSRFLTQCNCCRYEN